MHKLTAFVLVGLLCQQAHAQSTPSDTAVYRQGVQAAVTSYHQAIGVQAALYNGVEHVRYRPSIEGIPYFKADEWQTGTIEYGGVVYPNIPIKYELVKDQVVVRHPNGYSSFLLYSPRVAWFTMGGDRFVYLPTDGDSSVLKPGFYRQLRSGLVTVLARYTKWVDEHALSGRAEWEFRNRNSYYILKDGVYRSPRREGQLLALAGKRRSEARQALRKENIRFKKAPEQAMLIVADYINQ